MSPSIAAIASPNGGLLLAEMRRHFPFHPGGILTPVDSAQPNARHVIDGDFSYKHDWTENIEEPSSQVPEDTARKLADPQS